MGRRRRTRRKTGPASRALRTGRRRTRRCRTARRRVLPRLLGRHVEARSDDEVFRRRGSGPSRTCRVRDAGEPEIEDLHVTVGPDHEVVGLQVPVDDSRFVRPAIRASAVWTPMSRVFFDREGGPVERISRERPPVDVLHRDEGYAHLPGTSRSPTRRDLLSHLVDRDDVRVIQRRGRLASCSKRDRCAGSSTSSSGRTFRATARSRRTSVAR